MLKFSKSTWGAIVIWVFLMMTTSNVHLLRAEEDCAAINTNISYYSDELVRYSKKMMIELETAKSTLEANKYVFTKEQRDYLNSEIRKLQSEQVTTLSRYSEILTKLREEYTLCLQKYPDQVPAPANSNQTESGASSESSPTTSSETKTDIFTLCQNDFGTNATNFGENQCTCKEGYEWNSGQTSCQLKRTPEQACQEQYGAFAKDAGSGRCGCKSWYEWNSTKTSCQKQKTNDEVCKSEFGMNAVGAGGGNCTCKQGYEWNSEQTSCVRKKTTDELCRASFGPYSIDAWDQKCTCKEWYEWDTAQTMCQEAKKDAVTSLDAKTKAKVDVFFKKIQKKYASYDRTTAQNKFGKLLLQIESLESRLKGKNLAILLYLKSLVEKEIITISTNEFYELESIFSE